VVRLFFYNWAIAVAQRATAFFCSAACSAATVAVAREA